MAHIYLLVLFVCVVTVGAVCPPDAYPIAKTTAQGKSLVFSLLPYISDVDGNLDLSTLSVSWSANSPRSALLRNLDGQFLYVPEPGFVGKDPLTYRVCDALGDCASSEIVVLVTPPAQLQAVDDVFGPFFRTSPGPAGLPPLELDVLTNDGPTDAAVDACDVVILTQPASGLVYFVPLLRRVVFEAEAGQQGSYSFQYRLFDPSSGAAATARVQVIIEPLVARLPEPPTVVDRRVTLPVDSPPRLLAPSVVATSSDPDNDLDPGSLSIATAPASGVAWLFGVGELVYQPNGGFVGFDRIQYQLCDATALCSRANVYITVTAHLPPSVHPLTATTIVDQPVTVDPLQGGSGGDLPLDPTSLTVTGVPAGASVAVNAITGQLTFQANRPGIYQFSFSVCNSLGSPFCAQSVATVVVTTASPPVLADDAAYVSSGQTIAIGVLSNDYDPDDDLDPTTMVLVSLPVSGAVAYVEQGTFGIAYRSDPGYAGIDTFFYRLCDATQLCDTARVSVFVNQPHPPVANDLFAITTTDVPVTLLVDVADPDLNIDLGTLAVGAALLSNVTVVVDQALGALLYTPPPGLSLFTDHFTYFICDTTSLCSQALVTVSSSPNRPPQAQDDYATVAFGGTVLVNWAANDYDADGNLDLDSIVVNCPACAGQFLPLPNGQLLYFAPPSGTPTTVAAPYSVADSSGLTGSATVYVQLIDVVDQALTANDDAATTLEDQLVSITVTANDQGLPVNSLSIVDPSVDGRAVVRTDPNGVYYVEFTPNDGFVGVTVFTYQICNGATPGCDLAVVTVTVVRLRPLAQDDIVAGYQEVSMTVPVLDNDSDPQNNLDPASLVVIGAPLHGTTTVVAGQIVYAPAPGYWGLDDFWYEICDTSLFCDVARVSVVVRQKLPPKLYEDLFYTFEGVVASLDVLANDADPTIDVSTLTVVTQPEFGTLVIGPANAQQLLYTPPVGFVGTVSAAYSVCSLIYPGLCTTARIVIVVEPNLYPPTANDDFVKVPIGGSASINVLANDSDGDNNLDASSVAVAVAPIHGTATVAADGSILYVPGAQFAGSDVFTYSVCDRAVPRYCSSAVIYIDVVPNYAPPVVGADEVSTSVGVSVDFYPPGNDYDPDNNLDVASVSIVVQPTAGSIVCGLGLPGWCRFQPGSSPTTYPLLAEYRICDVSGLCSLGQIALRVDDDLPPVVRDDRVFTAQDTLVEIFVLLNDFDDHGLDTASLLVTVPPAKGTATVANGQIYYQPAPGFLGAVTLTYSVCDLAGQCATATVTITVGLNHPPVAANDKFSTLEGSAVDVPVGQNDYDPDGNLDLGSALASVGRPATGAFVVDPVAPTSTLAIRYVPAPGFVGTVSVPYTICDQGGLCSTATATVEVLLNHPPIADNDNYAHVAGTSSRYEPLANDFDDDGNLLFVTFALDSPSSQLTAYNPITGELTYTTQPGYTGTEVLRYHVCDSGGLCANATITIVTATDRAPVALDDVVQVSASSSVLVFVLANDADPDNNLAMQTLAVDVAPTRGTAVVQSSGTILYTPNSGVRNTFDTFRYRICDSLGLCSYAVVTVAIVDPYPRPIAVNDFAITAVNTPVRIDALANDINVDDKTVVALVLPPSNGYAYYNPIEWVWTVAPDTGFTGSLLFQYQLCSPALTCSQANVTVFVVVNTPPVANDDSATTAVGVPVTINVLANDVDADGNIDPTTLAIVTAPTAGSAIVVAATGNVDLLPPPLPGTVTFSYRICDLSGDCSTAAVTVDVLSNRPPIANDDFASCLESMPVAIDIARNDFDPDNNIDLSSVNIVTSPQHGSVRILVSSGKVVYTPVFAFTGVDDFDYSIADAAGLSATARVTVTVAPNHPPTAVPDVFDLPHMQLTRLSIVDNDYDIDGNLVPSSVRVLVPPGKGVVTIDSITGTALYVPSGVAGLDQFTYAVYDELGLSASTTVSILLQPPHPIAIDDFATTRVNVPVVVDVAINDIAPNAGSFAPPTISSPPQSGSVDVQGSLGQPGLIRYSPRPGFSGRDSYVYRICDRNLLCDVAIVSIYVTPDRAPVAADDTAAAVAGGSTVVPVLDNDFDPDGDIDASTLEIVSTANGRAFVDGGVLVFFPAVGSTGVATIVYRICDTAGLCSQATVTISVTANIAPTANDDSYLFSVAVGGVATTHTLTVLDNDVDTDDGIDVASVTALTVLPAGIGSVAYNQWTGSFSLLVTGVASGAGSFDYQVCDRGGLCDTAVVTVRLTTRRPPVAVDDSASGLRDQPLDIPILDNDYDLDGDLLTAVVVASPPSHGTVTADGLTGIVRYIPSSGYTGPDSFTYRATDAFGPSVAVATVSILLVAPTPPIANPDTAAAVGGGTVFIPVLSNDVGVDAPIDAGTLSVTTPPLGTVIVGSGGLIYTAASNSETFWYQICDQWKSCASTTVTVTVFGGPGSPPAANDDLAQAGPHSPVQVPVLANDADADADMDPTSLRVVKQPHFGQIVSVDVLTGQVTYLPHDGFVDVVDTFVYEICDSAKQCSRAAVSIRILANSAPPVAVPDSASTTVGVPVRIDLLVNDFDVDGDLVPQSVGLATGATVVGGTVQFDPATGQATFTPDGTLVGIGGFDYRVCDESNACSRAHVSVAITDFSPVGPNPDVYVMTQGGTLVGNLFDNDEIRALSSATIVSLPAVGTVNFDSATGAFTFDPPPTFVGTVTLTYQLCVLPGPTCQTAPVTVLVVPRHYPPVARDDRITVLQNAPATAIFVFDNDNAVGGVLVRTATTIVSPPTAGTASLATLPNSISYTPAAGFSGTATFVYQIQDDSLATAQATVTVTVLPSPPTLVLYDYYVKTYSGTPVSQYLLQNNLSPLLTPQDVSLTVTVPPAVGILSTIVTGVITYNPDPTFVGTQTFQYRGCYLTACTTATVHIDVRPLPICS